MKRDVDVDSSRRWPRPVGGRQRVAEEADPAILARDFEVISAVNSPNDYRGPQTGNQISDEKWAQLQNIRQAISPESI